jgi:hypothetical protein
MILKKSLVQIARIAHPPHEQFAQEDTGAESEEFGGRSSEVGGRRSEIGVRK